MTTELITISKDLTITVSKDVSILFLKESIDPILGKIKEEVAKFKPDMTTALGRKEIASMAAKVSKSKTLLDELGKNLVSGWKEQAKTVDTSRKAYRDELDKLRDEVRRPLTEFEDREEKRLATLREKIENIKNMGQGLVLTSAEISGLIKLLEYTQIGPEWGEFETNGIEAKESSLNRLNALLMATEAQELEKIELERLRAESLERDRLDRERRIADESALKAKLEAEEKAAREIKKLELEKENAEKKAKQEQEKANAEKQAALDAQKRAEDNARASEQKRIDSEKLVKEQRAAAEKKAIDDERARVQAQKEKDEVDQKKREANKNHKKKINNEILAGMIAVCGGKVDEELLKELISAMVLGKIPNVSVNY
jgi:hypothetical protein